MATPSIACIGIIGKHNNPLHISLFPATLPLLKYTLLLSTSLDIFLARLPSKTSAQDFGLLQAIDERLAMYGYMTNTEVKFVVVVDMVGREGVGDGDDGSGRGGKVGGGGGGGGGVLGVRDGDLKVVWKAVQTAYVRLLQNPFYNPDEHNPKSADGQTFNSNTEIKSRKFIEEIRRIGEVWTPGVTSI